MNVAGSSPVGCNLIDMGSRKWNIKKQMNGSGRV